MSVPYCYICNENPIERRRYGSEGLAEGVDCPVCNRPACRYHLTTVRWRWRENNEVGSALICKRCQRSYAHRHWDAINRDWIT